MKLILVTCAFVALVHCRPEPPSGYNYQSPPSSRYGAPSGAGGSSQGGLDSFGGGRGTSGGFQQGEGSASASRAFGQSSAGSGSSSGTIIVHKHVYVHVAPPELEEKPAERKQVHVPPPQKNYKIIFIKAPAPPAPTAPIIPPIPQNEEKTLVYVLVKKPEEQAEIVIPTAAPTEPSKPEVYFVKYKANKEESGAHGDVGSNEISHDDTVEVGARQDAQQGGADQKSYRESASSSSFSGGSSSVAVASQYGPPEARGPY